MKQALYFLVTLTALSMNASTAWAYDVPSFPSCSNPSGNIKVEYVAGQHAIVGEQGLREGHDKVYSLLDGNTLQCFCPTNGEGIQTNWWKINGNLSQDDINSLKNQGWVYVPSGRDWGLSDDPYLAKNASYSCKASGGGGSTLSTSSNGVGGGLILAATGDNYKLYGYLSLGLALLFGGTILRKNAKNSR